MFEHIISIELLVIVDVYLNVFSMRNLPAYSYALQVTFL